MKLSDIHYNADSGWFTALKSGGRRRAGDRLGYVRPDGYRMISVNGRWEYEHRLAWLISAGVSPTDEIDHINGARADNRLANLRPCTRSQNMMNTQKRGTILDKRSGKWRAALRVQGRRIWLGTFATEAEAAAAYARGVTVYHGEFGNIEPPKPAKQEALSL
mgnify:FL=1